MNPIPIIDHQDWQIRREIKRRPLYAMYASTTADHDRSQLMTVPVDDHLVHGVMAFLNRLSVLRQHL